MFNSSHTLNLFLLFFLCTPSFMICLSSSFDSTPKITQTTQYSVMGPNLDRLPSPSEALQLFLQWVREYGRVYKNLDELGRKFEIFLKTLKYVTESNALRRRESGGDPGYLLGLNEFADWSHDEFISLYDNPQLPTDQQHASVDMEELQQHENVSAPPPFLDWRAKGVVTSVRNQQNCGCCWAFAATGAIEGINAIETRRLISLSEQELLDCAISLGCKGGWATNGYHWVITNGIATLADYPYTAVQGPCRASQVPRSTSTITSYAYLPQTESALFTAILKQPISVSVYDPNDFQYYINGIYYGPNCPQDSRSLTNHAMLIVGYNTDQRSGDDYWIVKNSWGQRWGHNGYMYIKRNTPSLPYGTCGINAWANYPIRSPSPPASSDRSVSSM